VRKKGVNGRDQKKSSDADETRTGELQNKNIKGRSLPGGGRETPGGKKKNDLHHKTAYNSKRTSAPAGVRKGKGGKRAEAQKEKVSNCQDVANNILHYVKPPSTGTDGPKHPRNI